MLNLFQHLGFFNTQILPLWIEIAYYFYLPIPMPVLQLFLSFYSTADVRGFLKIDKFRKVISFCKTIYHFVFMFIHPSLKIIGNTYIKNSVGLVCENVNEILIHYIIKDAEPSLP